MPAGRRRASADKRSASNGFEPTPAFRGPAVSARRVAGDPFEVLVRCPRNGNPLRGSWGSPIDNSVPELRDVATVACLGPVRLESIRAKHDVGRSSLPGLWLLDR